jgi:polar amino acid transport system substrate-binding protein
MKSPHRRLVSGALAGALLIALTACSSSSTSSGGSATDTLRTETESLGAIGMSSESTNAGSSPAMSDTVTSEAASESAGASTATSSGEQPKLLTPGTLTVASVSDSKPNAYLDNGQWKGFDVDLITAIAKDAGLNVEIRAIDFSAMFPAIESGRFDLGAASSAGTVERQKIVGFSDGYLIGYLGVLTKKDSGITQDAASTAGKRIGLLQGSIQEGYAKKYMPDATVVTFPDNNSGVAGLRSGRIDGYFLDYVVGTQYIAQDADLHQPLTFPAFDLPAAFPIAKENQGLRDLVNAGIKKQVASGNYLALYKKYFPGIPVPKQLPPYPLPKG